jgi:hypothetical protein
MRHRSASTPTLLLVTMALLSGALACSAKKVPAPEAQAPCAGPSGVGTAVPAGLGPGDVVDAVELTDSATDSPGFPSTTRVWRVLYVSTGADEHQMELVCGLVALPSGGPAETQGSGRMLAWAHGTIGLEQRCLPSSDPATHLWGPMPTGIGAVAWGALLGAHQGEPADGALQYAMDQGWALAMPDYQPDDTYVMGKVAGGNVLDAARATAQIAAESFPATAPGRYDLITWGHSQGGHAALWAGQLAEPYLAATTPSRPTAELELVGVAALAPASNFIAQPDLQPDVSLGDGLADWETHQSVKVVPLPIPKLETQIGPALFSYIFGSWEQYSQAEAPADGSRFPAYPPDAPRLDVAAVATEEGRTTIEAVQPLCLAGSDATKLQSEVAPYRDAAAHRMLQPSLWNLPSDYTVGEYFHGGVDRSCAEHPEVPSGTGSVSGAGSPGDGTTDASGSLSGLVAWCEWIRWNMPGPLGDNPFPDAPMVDGRLVPVLIGQGTADEVIHCQAPSGLAAGEVPGPADCMSRALFESLRDDLYCPDGGAQGHLQLDVFRAVPLQSPATHFSIPGEMSARRIGRSHEDLRFEGSRMQEFMTAAFDGTLEAGCSAEVQNP